jgi:hypothetical protein
LFVLLVSVISATIPAWATGWTGTGEVVYETPEPPK